MENNTMEQRIGEKTAIVTGAGKVAALRLARKGANVVVADINPKTAEQTAEEIQVLNRRALVCHIDVASVAEIQPMIDRPATRCRCSKHLLKSGLRYKYRGAKT